MGKEYLYHFTSVENLLKIVISDRFMFNSIKNMNDIVEAKNIYSKDYIANDTYIKNYIYERFATPRDSYYINEIKWNIQNITAFFKTNKANENIIEIFKYNFEHYRMGKEILDIFFEVCSDQKETLDEINYEEQKDILENIINEVVSLNERHLSVVKTNLEERLYKKSNLKGMVDKFIENIYIGCFTSAINDEAIKEKYSIWAHYGKLNSGIAIKFCKKKLLDIFNNEIKLLDECEMQKDILRFSGKIDYDKIITESSKRELNVSILKYLIMHSELDEYKIRYIQEKTISKLYDTEYKRELEIEANNEFKKINLNFSEIETKLDKILKTKYLTKNKCWGYEEEYRLGMYIYDYSEKKFFLKGINSAIEGIIVGKKISDSDKYILDKLGKDFLKKRDLVIE